MKSALRAVEQTIGEPLLPGDSPPAVGIVQAVATEALQPPQKNPAAVALSRLGASKGGKARAAKLSKKRRAAIAKKAARTRWRREAKSE